MAARWRSRRRPSLRGGAPGRGKTGRLRAARSPQRCWRTPCPGPARRPPTAGPIGPRPGRHPPPGRTARPTGITRQAPLNEPTDPPRRGLHFRDAVAPFCVKMCVAAYFPKPSPLAQTTGISGLRRMRRTSHPALCCALEMLIRPAKRRTCAEREPQVEIFNGTGPVSPEKRCISQPAARRAGPETPPGRGDRSPERLPAQQAPSARMSSRAQRKKCPACRPSGGGRMRGIQAGGCLL